MVPEGRTAFRRATSGPETDFWVYEGANMGLDTGRAAAGLVESMDNRPITYDEMRPGCYDLRARLDDMTLNHVERSLCFPTFPRFCGQTFLEADDKELALACVRTYNDWMVEEWAGESGGRIVPLCLVPLWDVEIAAQEVRRNAARGVRAVAFSELPNYLGLPSLYDRDRYWDPLWNTCAETSTVICMHIGSASRNTRSADDAPPADTVALTSITSQLSLTSWLLSGVLARHDVKIAFSEGQVGWMPYLIERIDKIWDKFRGLSFMGIPVEIGAPPSSFIPGRIYGCVVYDDFGIQTRGGLGIEQITFESDYPHMDSTWPHTKEYAAKALAGYTDHEIRRVLRDNAIELFGLPEALPAA
jgi:predicted TIM-barrel fold metal-dependent hydrolase